MSDISFNKSNLIGKFLVHTSYVPTKKNYLTIVVLGKDMWDFEPNDTLEGAERTHAEMIFAAEMFSETLSQMEDQLVAQMPGKLLN